MTTSSKTRITVSTLINSNLEKAWECWNSPEHISQWNFASDDWTCPWAKVDLKVGGRQSSRMEAKDGSMGFEFGGTYTKIEMHKAISFTMDDKREVDISFEQQGEMTKVTETFDAENMNPIKMQEEGWQAILNNFKKHVESQV